MKNVLYFLLFSLPFSAVSQKKLNLTLLGGFSYYSGELQEKAIAIQQSHKAFGVGLSLQINPHFIVNGNLIKGKVAGHDGNSATTENRSRNLNFVSNIYEAALMVEFALANMEEKVWTPYVFGGVAIFRFNPYGPFGRLRPLSTEGQGFVPGRHPYKLIAISAPLGFGFKVAISSNTYLGYEIGFRKTTTDYLDDVSTTYIDQELLLKNRGENAVKSAFRGNLVNESAMYPASGTKRGSPENKDMYILSVLKASVGLLNKDGKLFGKTVRRGSVICPKW